MTAEVGGSGVVVQAAVSQLGKPYAWDTPINAADPNPSHFDCSGLTMWCYHKAGIKLGHQTNLQYHALKHRPLSEAQPGDLVFFGTLADWFHVGLYIGNSTIIEAPDYGIPVRRRVVNSRSQNIGKLVGVFPGSQTSIGGSVPVTYQQFFTDVLNGMGLPVTTANLRALARVSIIEGPNDRYNPLNSVVAVPGATSFNSVGVKDYGNYQSGVSGTIKLLTGSPWKSVVSALRQGNSEGGVINAFAQTYAGWGSHPNFSNASDSRADELLSTPIGTASKGTFVPIPYDPAKLKTPLTKTQRSRMLTFYVGQTGITLNTKISDADLIARYTEAVNHLGTPIVSNGVLGVLANAGNSIAGGAADAAKAAVAWAGSLASILAWLGNAKNWERIGLFALGAIVIIFAAVEFAKGV